MTKSLLEFTTSAEFKRRWGEGLKKAAATRARLELPKAVILDGVVYKEYPDGRRERIKTSRPVDLHQAPPAGSDGY